MNRKILHLAVSTALLGLASTSAHATEFQLRHFSKGLKAAVITSPIVAAPRLQLSGNPAASQNFGTIDLGDPVSRISFSVLNSGNAAGSLSLPAFEGADASNFRASTDCTNIPAGSSCAVVVAFEPVQPGYRTATLAVAGTSVTFEGTARLKTPNLQVSGNPAANQDFGNVWIGNAATSIAIGISNTGTAAGSLSIPAFEGANPQDFSATGNCANVAPGASCELSVGFQPKQAGYRTAALSVGGTAFTFAGTGQVAATQYVVLKSGTTYQIPAGVSSVTAWVIGGGGGGAGSIAVDGTSGGGGGAGGLSWKTFPVQPGQSLSYAFGAGGAGGSGGVNGTNGGSTTITYDSVALTAFGGVGGKYNAGVSAPGGSWSGGTGGANGGAGFGPMGERGGGGGGGVGAVSALVDVNSTAGLPGAKAVYPGGLDNALVSAGEPKGTAGVGSGTGSSVSGNNNNGGSATGVGNGGGGAGYYGGNGGNASYGGGGGGAAGYTAIVRGGNGGNGIIVLKLN